MRRLGGVVAACGTTAALLAPAAMSAADPGAPSSDVAATAGGAPAPVATTPAQAVNRPPLALLSPEPSATTAGAPVSLDASASSDPDGSIARYEWDLDGDGTYETDGGASSSLRHTFDRAGTREVGVRVTDDGGARSEGLLSLDVATAPSRDVAATPPPIVASPPPASTLPASSAAPPSFASSSASPPSSPSASPASSSASPPAKARARDSRSAPDRPVARAAATTSVTISDFDFSPGKITVNAGDTVRWTNAGPTGHSATGSGFDTGILAKGASGSETFSSAGTFSYICTPHPFMKGTVVVKAAGSGGSSSGGSGSSGSSSTGATDPFDSSGSSAASSTDAGASLPNTGTNVVLVAAIGAGFILAGLALRLAPGARRRQL